MSDILFNEIFKICSEFHLQTSIPANSIQNSDSVELNQLENAYKSYCSYSNSLYLSSLSDSLSLSQEPSESKTPRKKRKSANIIWKQYEDDLLKKYVSIYKHDWKKVVQRMMKLTDSFLRVSSAKTRYAYLKTGIVKNKPKKFSSEEDERILKMVEDLGFKWQEISEEFEDRNSTSIKNRYYYLN